MTPTPLQRDTIETLKAEYVIPVDAAEAFDEAGNVVFLNNYGSPAEPLQHPPASARPGGQAGERAPRGCR